MGYARKHKCYKSKFSIFIAKVQTAFQFVPDWYRKGEVREIVLQYYYILRSVLRANPHLKECLTRCRHCRIFFLTHPRNAGRVDLLCPFGCRQAHRKECSKKRSAEYYRSEEGKKKKKDLNGRRSLQISLGSGSKDLVNEEPLEQEVEVVLDKVTLSYIQMVVSLIEGRLVSLDEILKMLSKIMRQHSIGKRRRFVYAFTYSVQKPP